MKKPYYCLALLMATSTLAQTPIPRQGNFCPTGTYRSGNYCIPLKSHKDDKVIVKSGNDCPAGFYSAGDYCKRLSGSDREVIPLEGSRCPTGWYRSGGYCVKQ